MEKEPKKVGVKRSRQEASIEEETDDKNPTKRPRKEATRSQSTSTSSSETSSVSVISDPPTQPTQPLSSSSSSSSSSASVLPKNQVHGLKVDWSLKTKLVALSPAPFSIFPSTKEGASSQTLPLMKYFVFPPAKLPPAIHRLAHRSAGHTGTTEAETASIFEYVETRRSKW